jgi:hypothetical protein
MKVAIIWDATPYSLVKSTDVAEDSTAFICRSKRSRSYRLLLALLTLRPRK